MKAYGLKSFALLATLAFTSCHHKELCFDHTHAVDVDVVFDWSKAPEGNPSSMDLYMFDRATGTPYRYMFTSHTGGPIRIGFGSYDGLCFNSDDTDWARYRNTSSIETFEVYTSDVSMLSAYGLDTRVVPRAEVTASERVAATPGMVWSDREDNFDLPYDLTKKTITLYPEEAVCHYTVDIINVKNIEYLHGEEIDGTISGMSESFIHGQHKSSDTKVTMPFTLTAETDSSTLHSEFLTFGESPVTKNPHILTVYMILTDGSQWYSTFDVSKQVYDAPDPHHVHIIIDGLNLPKPMSTGGGFTPTVDDWQSVIIDIPM